MTKKRNNHNEGQIMIESIVGISVAITALLSSLSLVTSSLHYNSIVDRRLVGAHLAAEGIEIVRNMLDTNFATGASWTNGFPPNPFTFQVSYDTNAPITIQNGNPLLYRNGAYSYNALPGAISSGFIRDITTTPLTDPASGKVYAVSVSSTVRSADMENIVVEDRFYNWRQ